MRKRINPKAERVSPAPSPTPIRTDVLADISKLSPAHQLKLAELFELCAVAIRRHHRRSVDRKPHAPKRVAVPPPIVILDPLVSQLSEGLSASQCRAACQRLRILARDFERKTLILEHFGTQQKPPARSTDLDPEIAPLVVDLTPAQRRRLAKRLARYAVQVNASAGHSHSPTALANGRN